MERIEAMKKEEEMASAARYKASVAMKKAIATATAFEKQNAELLK